jgi:predicted nucleic acid-binding protein
MRERIYIDTCVLNRATDDQSQARIRTEAEALATVLDAAAEGIVDWIASSILRDELHRNPDPQRRQDALRFLPMASTFAEPTPATYLRALELRHQGHGEFDALHLAIAEENRATSLLSVDDRFLNRAGRRPAGTLPTVENPVEWCRRKKLWLIKRQPAK